MTAGRRDQLASALRRHGWVWINEQTADMLVDAVLLPLVDRMIRQVQAQALEQVADEFRARFGWGGGYGKTIRDRAAAPMASPSGADQPLGDETTPADIRTPAERDPLSSERNEGR